MSDSENTTTAPATSRRRWIKTVGGASVAGVLGGQLAACGGGGGGSGGILPIGTATAAEPPAPTPTLPMMNLRRPNVIGPSSLESKRAGPPASTKKRVIARESQKDAHHAPVGRRRNNDLARKRPSAQRETLPKCALRLTRSGRAQRVPQGSFRPRSGTLACKQHRGAGGRSLSRT